MHEYSMQTINRLTEHFKNDLRCIGVLLHGSGGQGTDDIYSDIDLTVVVDEKDYTDIRNSLRTLCSSICGDIKLWVPEGERQDYVNFAFLFEAEERQFLGDLAIFTFPAYVRKPYDLTEKILFDRDHILPQIREQQPRTNIERRLLPSIIEVYWLYDYLNGKYYRRRDICKTIYIMQTLFRHHMRLLGAFYPDTGWSWWPNDLQKLTVNHQQDMLSYMKLMHIADLPQCMAVVLDRFSLDAKTICLQNGLDYPNELEAYVRRHLQDMNVITDR